MHVMHAQYNKKDVISPINKACTKYITFIIMSTVYYTIQLVVWSECCNRVSTLVSWAY